MDAVVAGSADGLSRGELNEEMSRIEKELRRRLPIGWSTSYQSLVREFVTQQGYSSHALERTLFVLEKREVIRFSGQKKVVHRCVSLFNRFGCVLSRYIQRWRMISDVRYLRFAHFLCCTDLMFSTLAVVYVIVTSIRFYDNLVYSRLQAASSSIVSQIYVNGYLRTQTSPA